MGGATEWSLPKLVGPFYARPGRGERKLIFNPDIVKAANRAYRKVPTRKRGRFSKMTGWEQFLAIQDGDSLKDIARAYGMEPAEVAVRWKEVAFAVLVESYLE